MPWWLSSCRSRESGRVELQSGDWRPGMMRRASGVSKLVSSLGCLWLVHGASGAAAMRRYILLWAVASGSIPGRVVDERSHLPWMVRTISAQGLQPLPAHVSFPEAAAVPIAFGAAWHMLIT